MSSDAKVNLEEPVELVGPAGRRMVPRKDVDRMTRDEGYQHVNATGSQDTSESSGRSGKVRRASSANPASDT